METGSRGVGINIFDAKYIRFCVREIDEAEMVFVKTAFVRNELLVGMEAGRSGYFLWFWGKLMYLQ